MPKEVIPQLSSEVVVQKVNKRDKANPRFSVKAKYLGEFDW